MDMIGIIAFCDEHDIAGKLKLDRPLVLKTILDQVHMLLDAGIGPHDTAHAALDVLEIVALNNHGDTEPALPSIMALENALVRVIETMLANEVPPIRLTDTGRLEAFFNDYALAETLRIPQKEGWESFLNSIQVSLLQAQPPERIAEETLSLMEGVAATHAAKTRTYEYQLVGHLKKELEAAIRESLPLV